MRITFQNMTTDHTADNRKTANKEPAVQRIGTNAGYALDISGTVTDNSAYKGQGKTTEEVMQQAGGTNVALMQDYMTVMSNILSDEDYAKLQENGFCPGSTRIEETVTIVDHIKASLIQAGVSIQGYTDTIDENTLTQITGNPELARQMRQAFAEEGVALTEQTAGEAMQALEEASSLTKLSDDTVKYMVQNQMDPQMDQVYLAQHSSLKQGSRQARGYYQDDAGYLARKADQADYQKLQPQIDKILEEAGYADNEQAAEGARWLIDNGVALTKDTLTSYMRFQEIQVPVETTAILSQMAAAVSDGRKPGQADLTGAGSLWKQAGEIWQKTGSVTEEAVDMTVVSGKKLTLRNLFQAQEFLNAGQGREKSADQSSVDARAITARRQLEEVRLQMTVIANRELLKSGYAIETAELEDLVEALRDAESRQNQILFGGDDGVQADKRADLYHQTLDTVRAIPGIPLAVTGRIAESGATVALPDVLEEGERLAAAYQKANERYETFFTTPRADMGDSIRKAFQNAEVLVTELGFEPTEDNLRAVRSLGYNSMEITEENIIKVKTVDVQLQNITKKMTPAAVLQMIREGKNPLEMSLGEMDDMLDDQEQNSENEQEKYSKYLYKLEQKKEITDEERESYIGIYRLLKQIEKSDGAVIGSLVNQGVELSFKNMLSALRTSRRRGIDAQIDDDFGAVQEIREPAVSISDQINTAYDKALSHKVFGALDADKISRIHPDENMTLESFAQELTQMPEDTAAEELYQKEQIDLCRQTEASGEAFRILDFLQEPVTLQALAAAEEYLQGANDFFKRLQNVFSSKTGGSGKGTTLGSRTSEDSWKERIVELEENFVGRQEAQESYQRLAKIQSQLLEESMYERDDVTSFDIRQMGLLYKQISFTAKLAGTEQYEIPVLSESGDITAVHLKLVHSDEEKGMVEATMHTDELGDVSVKCQVGGSVINGFLIGSDPEASDALEGLKETLKNKFEGSSFAVEEMGVGYNRHFRADFKPDKADDENVQKKVSTRELYRVAKIVISAIREQAERRTT